MIRHGDLGAGLASRRVWVRGNHRADQSILFRSSMTLYEFNCTALTMRVLSIINYHADGRVHSSAETTYSQARYVVPESVGEGLHRAVCQR